ncbi:FxLYD domain-containing protein [Priestia flexa]|uniref:FxLYD domain-containing protein n=1 Tax=Priestia flexa TaxID=86664 RepID=UPI00249311D4|nr:FxLYD domain-containing protein [Priestia flexa]
MKKKLLIGTVAFGLLLAGCGKDEAADKTVKANGSSSGVNKTQEQAEMSDEEIAKRNAKIKISIVDEVNYPHYDNIMDENSVYHAAIIKNDSKETVDVSSISIAYLDKNGTVVGSDDSSVWVSPSLLKPGQKAYVMDEAGIDVPFEEYGKTEVTISPEITEERAKNLPIEGEALSGDEDTIFLKGKVKNTSDIPTDYITVAAALYDVNDKFVGVTYGQVQDTLNPDNSKAFQTDSYNFTAHTKNDLSHYEILAYMYKWPEGTAGEDGDGEVTN